MKKIITISREFASGGRTVGKMVAEKLGYAFYDNELIDMAAKESGLSPDFIKKTEQNVQSSWLYNMMTGSIYATGVAAGAAIGSGNPLLPLPDQVFNAQRKTIIDIAHKENCVIVGRCADYILKTCDDFNEDEIINIFIYADQKDKVNRAITKYGIPEDKADKTVTRINKNRSNHYNTFTEDTWGDRSNYDLMVNTSLLGINESAEIITHIAKKA